MRATSNASNDGKTADLIEARLHQLSKTGRILRVVFLVIAGLLVICAIGSVAPVFFRAFSYLGGIKNIEEVSLDLLLSACVFLVFAALFFTVSLVFKDIANGDSPFTLMQARRIRLISWLLFVYAVLDTIIPKGIIVGGAPEGRGLSLVRFDSEFIKVNICMFAVAVIFYFLSSVFKYGVELQELSDDTV